MLSLLEEFLAKKQEFRDVIFECQEIVSSDRCSDEQKYQLIRRINDCKVGPLLLSLFIRRRVVLRLTGTIPAFDKNSFCINEKYRVAIDQYIIDISNIYHGMQSRV